VEPLVILSPESSIDRLSSSFHISAAEMRFRAIILIFPALIAVVASIFKEQEGEYNWRKSFLGLVTDSSFSSSPRNHQHDSNSSSTIFTTSYNATIYSAVNAADGSIAWRFLLPRGSRMIASALLKHHATLGVIARDDGSCSLISISIAGTIVWDADVDVTYCLSEETTVTMHVKSSPSARGGDQEVVSILTRDRIMVLSDISSLNLTSSEWALKDISDTSYSKDQRLVMRPLSLPSSSARAEESGSKVFIAYGCVVSSDKKKANQCIKSLTLAVDLESRALSTSTYKGMPATLQQITAMTSATMPAFFMSTEVVADGVRVHVLELARNELLSSTYLVNNLSPDKSNVYVSVHGSMQTPLLSICGLADGCELLSMQISLAASTISFYRIHQSSMDRLVNAFSDDATGTVSTQVFIYAREDHDSIEVVGWREEKVKAMMLSGHECGLVHVNYDHLSRQLLIQGLQGSLKLIASDGETRWRREEGLAYAEQLLMVSKLDSAITAVEGSAIGKVSGESLQHIVELVSEPTVWHRFDLQRVEVQVHAYSCLVHYCALNLTAVDISRLG
jgi:hypothetical protein